MYGSRYRRTWEGRMNLAAARSIVGSFCSTPTSGVPSTSNWILSEQPQPLERNVIGLATDSVDANPKDQKGATKCFAMDQLANPSRCTLPVDLISQQTKWSPWTTQGPRGPSFTVSCMQSHSTRPSYTAIGTSMQGQPAWPTHDTYFMQSRHGQHRTTTIAYELQDAYRVVATVNLREQCRSLAIGVSLHVLMRPSDHDGTRCVGRLAWPMYETRLTVTV